MHNTNKTEKILKQIIVNQWSKSQELYPQGIDVFECSKSKEFKTIILEVDENFSFYKKYLRVLISKDILDGATKTFSFILSSAFNNQKSLEFINKHLKSSLGLTISNNEIVMAQKSPASVVKSKLDVSSDQAIQDRIDELILAYDQSQHQNLNYISHKESFVLALYLLESEIMKLDNPIEDISNDYSLFEKHFKERNATLVEGQFSKYKLVEIDDNVQIVKGATARIHDIISDTTIFLCGVEDYLLDYLSELKNINLSLKPSSLYFVNGKFDKSFIIEHLEIGEYFDVKNLDKELITKLYDNQYDNLWVNIDGSNITFEEILQDASTFNNMYISQVIHAEYVSNCKGLFVTHIDHEFIFYTAEEFKRRQSDVCQKGQAQKRIKTFKIDNSEIPITDSDNILFLILKIKFENQMLLEEYFNKVGELN
ncbi:hypothetical protein OS175_10960 [Marinicella sp. S1101]|nr:hypothetical protein [Marinicella marina]MCX7554402.1 hypothetical protein [Marinicella marina]